MPLQLRQLPSCDAEALRGAIQTAVRQQTADVTAPSVGPRSLIGRLPPSTRLENGAEQFVQESPEDAEAARYFAGIVEASYLVAGADGLAETERAALIQLVSEATGRAIDADDLNVLFELFDERVQRDGLEARLVAVADNFDDFMARGEAMSFAVLVAIADGVLAPGEGVALTALGARLGFAAGEVQAVLDQVVTTIELTLSVG